MPSDHPPSPQSPSQSSFDPDLPPKIATSPRTSNSLPTPAHSINGSMSSTASEMMAESANMEESSNKRKRDLEDHGDREQKKVHVEDSRISIKDLHVDVGEKYLLCRTPHPPTGVPFSTDLFESYGLSDVALTVARLNPDGKKNVIRKTYKNYISKVFQLPGAFEADKKEIEAPDSLWAMMTQPEDVWDSQYRLASKEIATGLPEQAVSSLGKAVTMARVKNLPKAVWDESILGTHSNKGRDEAAKQSQNGARTPIPHPQNPATQRTSKGEPPRPKRNIKKRTYGDASFEGYGEGFVDDDLHDTGYSTGDGDDRNGGRKRPKKSSAMSSQPALPRQLSYGPGSIGV